MISIKSISFSLLAFLIVACSTDTQSQSKSVIPPVKNTVTYIDENGNRQLAMPKMPENLKDIESRASHLAENYWTNLSFGDTLVLHDKEFMEQTFVNFLSVLPMSRERESLKGIDSLWRGAQGDTIFRKQILDLSEKYLYDPNSPMLNENIYNLFLQVIIPTIEDDFSLRERLSFQKRVTETNRVGHLASNFTFRNSEGKHSFFDIHAPYTLLMFFDPDCGHCNEYLEALKSSAVLNNAIKTGMLKVVAIYAEQDKNGYGKAIAKLPTDWINGYDEDDMIQSSGLYFLRAMPTLLVLDENKFVVMKDCTPDLVEQFAASLK